MARRDALDAQLVEDARAAGPEDPFYNRGLLAFPRWCPKPLEEGGVVFTRAATHQDQRIITDPAAWTLEGPTFQDGSAKPHQVKELARAGWGIALLNPSGETLASVSGPVWAPLPQTSACAEWLSFAMLAQFAGPAGVTPHQDYQNLVRMMGKEREQQLKWSQPFAGLLRSMWAFEGAGAVAPVKKVKAHQDAGALSGQLRWEVLGNNAALCRE